MGNKFNIKSLTLGVDTHLDKHVAVLVDNIGQVIDTKEIAVSTLGYAALLKWPNSFSSLTQAGIKGTGI